MHVPLLSRTKFQKLKIQKKKTTTYCQSTVNITEIFFDTTFYEICIIMLFFTNHTIIQSYNHVLVSEPITALVFMPPVFYLFFFRH